MQAPCSPAVGGCVPPSQAPSCCREQPPCTYFTQRPLHVFIALRARSSMPIPCIILLGVPGADPHCYPPPFTMLWVARPVGWRPCRPAMLSVLFKVSVHLSTKQSVVHVVRFVCWAARRGCGGITWGAGMVLAQQRLIYVPAGLAASIALTSAGFTLQTVGLKDGNSLVVIIPPPPPRRGGLPFRQYGPRN